MAENDATTGQLKDRPASELFKQLSDQTTQLVRQEIELAKLEVTEKGKRAGVGAGMFGGAGVVGAYALGVFITCAILALSTALAAWLAALIVGVVLAAVAGVLALRGKAQVQKATPPVPQEAVESTKEDVRWVKTKAQEARK
jgi:MFS family permease